MAEPDADEAHESAEDAMAEMWKDRYPDEVTCVRCLEVKPKDELDRLLWCDDCVERARVRASRWGWVAGLALAALLAVWIVVAVQPNPNLVLGGWIATVVAACWIGAKVAREIGYGIQRYRNRRAVEAVPPRAAPAGSEEEGEDDVPGPKAPPPG